MASNIHLYYGEETLQVEENAQAFLKENNGLQKEVFSDTHTLSDLHLMASSVSMFATQTLIVAKHPWFLKKALSDAELKVFETILDAITKNGHKFLIYLPGKSVDKRTKTAKLVLKCAHAEASAAFQSWDQSKIYDWIKNRCRSLNKHIEQDAVMAIEESGGTDLMTLAKIIDTLITYTLERPAITLDDVRAVSSGSTFTAFDLTNALKNRDKAEAIRITKHLLDAGEDAIPLMGLIASSWRLYLQILLLLQAKKSYQDIGKELKKNPFYIKRLIPDIQKRYTVSALISLYSILNTQDIAIKSGKCAPQNAILLAVGNL